jgi:hypothetical protein
MNYVDPHIHMVSRVTDDYEALARMGCVAVSEPAFWAGFDRRSADGFRDYFRQITEVEPRRAAGYGIAHYSWLCINAKEAEDVKLARDVIAAIPEFLSASNVLGIGEIVEPLPFEPMDITLVIPPLAVSTPAAYRAWDELGMPRAEGPNDLEPAALVVEPQLARWRDRIREAAGVAPVLAGSGATWFLHGHHDVREALPDAMVVLTRTA